MAIPLGVLGAIYLNEYGKQKPLARTIRIDGRRDDRRALDRHGPVHLHRLGAAFQEQTGFAGSLALACLMLPVVHPQLGGDAPAGPRRAAPGEPGAGRAPLADHRAAWSCRPRSPASPAASLLAIARAAGETAPSARQIGLINTVNPNLFSGPNTALSTQIFRNASQPFAVANDRAWGAALTLVAIVLVITIIARFIANRFAIKER